AEDGIRDRNVTGVQTCALPILVDPAWHAEELRAIADVLADRGLQVELGWATHAHHDHLLWHPRFGSAPRWATPSAAATARVHLADRKSTRLNSSHVSISYAVFC